MKVQSNPFKYQETEGMKYNGSIDTYSESVNVGEISSELIAGSD